MKIPVSDAIDLLHRATHCVLASNSSQLPGYPYATALPLVVDDSHFPIVLISALAEHTKNLLHDKRASLSVIDPGLTNIQNGARMTLIGQFEKYSPPPEILARYLRYVPEAKDYLKLDFMFFRMSVEHIRFIGGVGRMGWLDADDLSLVERIPASVERELLVEIDARLASDTKAVGLDAYGIDFETATGRFRWRFPNPQTANNINRALPELIDALHSAQFCAPT